MKVVNLSLGSVRTDGGTQMRAELSTDVYMDYREKMLAGDEFPPIDVFYDGSTYWLADGFHRFYGAREAKLKTIPATIHQGTQRDAILFAAGANAKHGLKRTNADKRNSVLALLNDEEWRGRAVNWIAEKCGVSDTLVTAVKKEIQVPEKEPEKVKGKDGKSYPPKAKPKTFNELPEDRKPLAPSLAIPVKDEPAAEPDKLEELQGAYDELLRNLSAIKRDFNALCDDPANNAYLLVIQQRVNRAYEEFRTPIVQARPEAYCKKCPMKGGGCKACHQQGWLSKFDHGKLPEASR